MKDDLKVLAALLLMALCFICVGFRIGFTYVVMNSEAYCINGGDTLVMVIDDHAYHYLASPAFNKKLDAWR